MKKLMVRVAQAFAVIGGRGRVPLHPSARVTLANLAANNQAQPHFDDSCWCASLGA